MTFKGWNVQSSTSSHIASIAKWFYLKKSSSTVFNHLIFLVFFEMPDKDSQFCFNCLFQSRTKLNLLFIRLHTWTMWSTLRIKRQNIHTDQVFWLLWAGGSGQTALLSSWVLTLVFNDFFNGLLCIVAMKQINVYVYCICVSQRCVQVPGKITSTREGVGQQGHFWISWGLRFWSEHRDPGTPLCVYARRTSDAFITFWVFHRWLWFIFSIDKTNGDIKGRVCSRCPSDETQNS